MARAKRVTNIEAGAKAGQSQALRELAPIAKEINHRISEATKYDGKALDHRLAACLQLASAKAKCKAHKVTFKAWVTENLKLGYDPARKLATIGEKSDPKAALEYLRKRTALAQAESMARKTQAASKPDPKPDPKPGKSSRATADGPIRAPRDPMTVAGEALAALDEGHRVDVLKSLASKVGFTLAEKQAAERKPEGTPDDIARAAFSRMTAQAQQSHLQWCAQRLGAIVAFPDRSKASDDELFAIPDNLKRAADKPKARKRSTASKKGE